MEKEFPRKDDVGKLLKEKDNHLIKVVTGLRKVGKSFLLSTLFKRQLLSLGVSEDHIICVDLSLDENESLLDKAELRSYIDSRVRDEGHYYLVLDEIQEVEGFEKLLLSYNAKGNIDLYVTGSNSHNLSSDIDTRLRGSDSQIHLYPISFEEYLASSGSEREAALTQYLRYGGMPLALLKNDDGERQTYLSNLFQATYLSDIEARHDIRNKPAFERLCDILSSTVGSLTNPTVLESTFKTYHFNLSNDAIASYLSYLTDAFLFEECKRYDVKGKQYISTPAKYYCGDLGLRNARLAMRDVEYQQLLENAIYLELRRRGCLVDVGVVPMEVADSSSKTRTYQNYEIDFVVNKGNKRIYLQAAMDFSKSGKEVQETRSLDHTRDHFAKFIVLKESGHPGGFDENGYFVISLADFLLNKDLV